MKKLMIISAFLSVLMLFSGCSPIVDKLLENQTATFEIPYYGLEFTADGRFEKVENDSAWDIQVTDGNSYFGVMAFNYIDLPEGQTPEGVYDLQNEDILGKRDNVYVVSEEKGEIWNEITYLNTVYSAERDGTKNYYSSYLVDMEEDGVFAWVLVTSTPSYLEKNAEEFKEMVYSIKYVSDAED